MNKQNQEQKGFVLIDKGDGKPFAWLNEPSGVCLPLIFSTHRDAQAAVEFAKYWEETGHLDYRVRIEEILG